MTHNTHYYSSIDDLLSWWRTPEIEEYKCGYQYNGHSNSSSSPLVPNNWPNPMYTPIIHEVREDRWMVIIIIKFVVHIHQQSSVLLTSSVVVTRLRHIIWLPVNGCGHGWHAATGQWWRGQATVIGCQSLMAVCPEVDPFVSYPTEPVIWI